MTTTNTPRYLRRVDMRSTLVIAAVFNAIVGVALTLTGWFLIALAAQRGLLDQINEVTSDLSTGQSGHVSALRLCLVWTAVVACWVVAVTVVAALATFVFNHILEVLGGIELDLRDEPAPPSDVQGMVRRSTASLRSRLRTIIQPSPVLDVSGDRSAFPKRPRQT